MFLKFFTLCFGLSVLVASSITVATLARAEGENVVAVIDGVSYTEEQLKSSMQHILSNPQANYAQIYPMLLEQFIVERMMTQSAKEKGYDKDDRVLKDLDRALESIMNNYYVSDFLDEVITDEMIADAYKAQIEAIPSAKEVLASHILLETEEEANDIITKLKAGEDFAVLAKEFSVGPSSAAGGSLGYFTKGSMVPAFEAATFDLEVGSFTVVPVQTQFGYHVILLEDRRDKLKPTLAEMRDELHETLSRQQVEELLKRLRAEVKVERFDVEGNPIGEFPINQ